LLAGIHPSDGRLTSTAGRRIENCRIAVLQFVAFLDAER